MRYNFTSLLRAWSSLPPAQKLPPDASGDFAWAAQPHTQALPADSLGVIAWMLREGRVIPPHLADPLARALLRIDAGQLRDARAIFLVLRQGGRYDAASDRSWRQPRDALIASAVASAPGTSLTAQAQHVLDTVNALDPVPGTTRQERELRETFGGRPEMQLSTSQMVRIARGRSGRAPAHRLAKKRR